MSFWHFDKQVMCIAYLYNLNVLNKRNAATNQTFKSNALEVY